jgi:hypothetical protein
MSKLVFPLVMSSERELHDGILRVVTDQEVNGRVVARDGSEMNKATGNFEEVFSVLEFSEIKEQRPAKGDWSQHEVHPTYYNGIGKVKRMYKSQLQL